MSLVLKRVRWQYTGFCYRLFRPLAILLVLNLYISNSALAVSGQLFEDVLSNPSAFLANEVVNAAVKSIGNVFAHRAYEPATPMTTQYHLDVGIEAGVIQLPRDLSNAFLNAGLSVEMPPVFPMIKYLNVHKSLSDSLDIGGSYVAYMRYVAWALEAKLAVYQPEEGPTWAIRFCYTNTNLPIGDSSLEGLTGSLSLNAKTFSPQILISKKLDFADPYLGVGYNYILGTVKFEVSGTPAAGVAIQDTTEVTGRGQNFVSFMGVSFTVPHIGLRLVLQGEYSPAGYNSVGSKIGIRF
jgi:hypothetical protein